MRQTALLTAVVLFVWIFPASAQLKSIKRLDGSAITPAEADATITRLMKAADIPGLEVAIFNDNKVAYLKAFGFRDKDRALPLTVNSVLSAASFSKVTFAYLVLKLVDDGVLDLDKPVYEYLPKPLPEYPKYADLANEPDYKLITARMLLDHTSGFANWRWFEDDRKLKIHFQPGSRYAYSGEGIDLLQLVVETITKKPLEELMQERVFRPLGMTRTSMVWQSSFETDYANGYDEHGRFLGPQRRNAADAAGSMQTTIADFSRFIRAVMAGTGLHKTIYEQMLTPQIQIFSKYEFPTLLPSTTDENRSIRLSYGLGWGLYWTPYGKAFFKEGHDEGWRNYVVCYQPKGIGLVIMTNSSNGEGVYKALLRELQEDTWNPVEWEGFAPYDKLPSRSPRAQHNTVSLPAAVLEMYVGRYGRPNMVLNVRREGDHLSVQENDEPKEEVFPQSGTDFFSKTSDHVFTFLFDSQTHAIQMLVHAGGKDILIKQIE